MTNQSTLPAPTAPAARPWAALARPGVLSWARLAPVVALVALTLIGLLLRRYRLGAQGLWFDEADLVARAREPLAELLAAFVRPGENGPFYSLLLAAWVRLAGDGELALRTPSLIAGTLAIPTLALLGRALGGWRVGLLAAGLLAISPYAIWYSQDAKMYALMTLLMPASWLLLLVAARRNRPGWWLAYTALSVVSLGVHVASGLVWLSQALAMALSWPRLGPARRPWALTAAALLLPSLALGIWRAGYLLSDDLLGSWQPAVALPQMLAILVTKLAVNRADTATEWWGTLLWVSLAWLGTIAWGSRRVGVDVTPSPRLVLTCAVAVPVLGFYLLTLRVPLFQDRYLIAVLPAMLLLIAGALDWLLRRAWPLALLALAVLLALAWVPLRDVVYAADSQKEDWAAAYRFVDAHARNGDVVIVHPGYLRTTADYYARRLPNLAALPIITLPSLNTADFGERELDAALADQTWGKTRVWLITSPERLASDDPRGLLRRWYEGNTLRFADHLFNGVRVETYSYNGPLKAGLWRPEIPLRADFGDQIGLVGATWDGLGPGHTIAAGDWARLTLRWRALQSPLTTDYVVRVRLRDAAGREVTAYDIQPLDGNYPTTRWGREQVWDYHDLHIPSGLPAGSYDVVVGLSPVGRPDTPLLPSVDAVVDDSFGVSVGTLLVTA